MRRPVAAFALLLVLGGGVRSATDELDPDLMHGIEDTNKSLASNIATQQGAGASADARELNEMFAQVEAYFEKKGNDAADAVALAKKSRALSAQIVQSVSASDFATATDSATNLSRTCKTCHSFYKKS
jgi:hypothetical protein